MRIFLPLFFVATLAHSDEELTSRQLFALFQHKIEQRGTLILTPTDEASNESAIQYGEASMVFENKTFKIEVELPEQKKKIVMSYNNKDGYSESWIEGKKKEPFKASRISDFYSKLFLGSPEALALFYSVKQRAILDDDSQLNALRYELSPKAPGFPKAILLIAPDSKKIFMLSLSYRGQSFIWTDDDYTSR